MWGHFDLLADATKHPGTEPSVEAKSWCYADQKDIFPFTYMGKETSVASFTIWV